MTFSSVGAGGAAVLPGVEGVVSGTCHQVVRSEAETGQRRPMAAGVTAAVVAFDGTDVDEDGRPATVAPGTAAVVAAARTPPLSQSRKRLSRRWKRALNAGPPPARRKAPPSGGRSCRQSRPQEERLDIAVGSTVAISAADTWLLARLGSFSASEAEAVFTSNPPTWTCTRSSSTAWPPDGSTPTVQVPLAGSYVPCPGVAETNAKPAGSGSLTVTFVAGSGPALPHRQRERHCLADLRRCTSTVFVSDRSAVGSSPKLNGPAPGTGTERRCRSGRRRRRPWPANSDRHSPPPCQGSSSAASPRGGTSPAA